MGWVTGSSRTSDRTSDRRLGLGVVETARAALAVVRFELGIQRREPATVLYALVFLLLTFAFVSSDTVALVRRDLALPHRSPLAIALAMGGLTAFGQVITTMIVASAFLRDAAGRTDELLFSTPLPLRAWMLGRWMGALLAMVVVYSAIVAGVLLGAAAPWLPGDMQWRAVAWSALRVWLMVTLPTTVAVATLLSVAAVQTRRLLGVLAASLALLFVWQGAEAVRASVAASSRLATAASLLDPFGTTALQVVTADWSASERGTHPIPLGGLVGASRALWLAIAAGLGGVALVRGRRRLVRESPGADRVTRPTGISGRAASAAPRRASVPAPMRHNAFSSVVQFGAIAAFTLRWTWRERGWRVIAGLGALNVLAHALGSVDPTVVSTLLLTQEHARLFLILLATIYAGELLWRDHDERVLELVQSAPLRTRVLVLGRLCGLAVSQAALVMALLGAAALGALVRTGTLPSVARLAGLGALWLYVPFVQWTVLALTVHVLLRHKVVAHLMLIAGWVLAVVLDANGLVAWWLRFADPPALRVGGPAPVSLAAWHLLWWSAVSAALLALTVWRWRAATSRR